MTSLHLINLLNTALSVPALALLINVISRLSKLEGKMSVLLRDKADE